MAEADRLVLMGQVARLYYAEGATQEEIARRLDISRPTISRLLRDARSAGVVEITIHTPLVRDGALEAALGQAYPWLKAVIVLRRSGGADPRPELGRAAADYLSGLVRDGDGVGVGWGSTMAAVAGALARRAPLPRQGVTVSQLSGGVGRAEAGTNAAQVVEGFRHAFAAAAHFLPVPAIVDSPAVRAVLAADSQVARLLDWGRRARLAVFGIGAPRPDSVMIAAGYLTAADMGRLRAAGAVGDILGRYFDGTGRMCDPELDNRTVGLALSDLPVKEYSVAVAGGAEKAAAILGALQGRFVNALITDAEAARPLLEMARPGSPHAAEAEQP